MCDDNNCKCYAATPSGDLFRDLMDSNIAKSEREWFAKKKIEELQEEIIRLQSIIDGDFEVKRFHYEDGKFDAAFEGSVVKVIAAELVNLYKSAGGGNYLSLELRDPDTEERFEIIIQRCLGERPAEKAKRLQKELDDLKVKSV